MSISANARLVRIDDHFISQAKKFNSLNSQLQALIREVSISTAFMHNDPRNEFTQEDRDKYSNEFVKAITAPNGFFGTVALIQPMLDVEQGTKTPAEFVAEETGYNAETFSKQFD